MAKQLIWSFVILIAFSLCACQDSQRRTPFNINSTDKRPQEHYTISATIPNSSSKVDVDGVSLTWSENETLTVAKISIESDFATIEELLDFTIDKESISEDKRSAAFTGEPLDESYYYMAIAFGDDSAGLVYDGTSSYEVDLRLSSMDAPNKAVIRSELFTADEDGESALSLKNIFSLFEFDYRVSEADDKSYTISEIKIESSQSEIYQLLQFGGYDQDLVGCDTEAVARNIVTPQGFSLEINRDEQSLVKFYAFCSSKELESGAATDLTITAITSEGLSSSIGIEGLTAEDIRNGVRYTKELRFEFAPTTQPYFTLQGYSSGDTIEIDAAGGELSLEVDTNEAEWDMVADFYDVDGSGTIEEDEKISFVTLSKEDNGIKITTSKNSEAQQRSQLLQVTTDSGANYSYYITQAAAALESSSLIITVASDGTQTDLTENNTTINISAEKNENRVSMLIISTKPWSYVASGSGMSVVASVIETEDPDGSYDSVATFPTGATLFNHSFEANESSEERTITVTFKVDGETDFVVKYLQAGSKASDSESNNFQLSDLVNMAL